MSPTDDAPDHEDTKERSPNEVMAERDRLIRLMEGLITEGDKLEELRAELAEASEALNQRVRGLAQAEAVLQKRKRQLQADIEALGQRKNEFLREKQRIHQAYDALEHKVAACDEQLMNVEVDDALESAFARPVTVGSDAPPWPVAGAGPVARRPEPESEPESESESEPENTRRQPRLAVVVDVDLHSEHHFYTGLTENLSEGGLFVASYDMFPLGTVVELTLNLEDMPAIKTRAEVRWVRPPGAVSEEIAPGMGLQFLDLSDEDRAMIRAFMEVREPMFLDGLD